MATGEGGESAAGVGATAENWQLPPFNRWAFWHVRDILPTLPIPRRSGPPRELIQAHAPVVVTDVTLTSVDGSVTTAGQVMTDTYTDAYVVLQDGELVAEWYAPEGAPERTHAVLSISKSVVGCVAAALVDRNLLDTDQPVTAYVPELSASGYAGATVRHLLDMRSGVRFREDYLDPEAELGVFLQVGISLQTLCPHRRDSYRPRNGSLPIRTHSKPLATRNDYDAADSRRTP